MIFAGFLTDFYILFHNFGEKSRFLGVSAGLRSDFWNFGHFLRYLKEEKVPDFKGLPSIEPEYFFVILGDWEIFLKGGDERFGF